jgi:TolB-like protein/Tfp pilus assembly protein PilF
MADFHAVRGTVRFATFELDFSASELRKQGAKVKLQEQPFQILQVLLQRPGEIVTREELQQKIWPSDTFVDFDHGLYNAIKRLREALGDSAETPQYVETLARRGYRFVGKIDCESPRVRSLAVLPLENLSRDPEQEYFAEGLTEALITTLAKIGELRVVSRTSIMLYKGVRKPLREIARELEVDAIVEGTVLRIGRRVRITAQLIDVAKESHLWAESYERDLRDVLALQSELARAIAREIRIKLTPVDQARFADAPVNPEAYDAYLRGRYHWNRRSSEGLVKAIEKFRDATAKDPTYPSAYAGLADCLAVLGFWGAVPPNEGCGKAKELAQKALDINPSLAEAHASLAFSITFYDYDFITAEREFNRSIELDPRYATGHYWFGFCLGMTGRYEEGYTELRRAIGLDPHAIMYQTLGSAFFFAARRYDQAVEQYKKALELDPLLASTYCLLGLAYSCKSLHEPAIASARKAVELSDGSALFTALLGDVYAAAGYRDEAEKILGQLQELSKQRYVTPYAVARLYAALGKQDEALRWLETAYRERAALMVCLKTDPGFDDLRPDLRFQNVLRRMNFPG